MSAKAKLADKGGRAVGRASRVLLWEWLVAVAGLLLVVGSIGYLVYTSLTQGPTPPAISVVAQAVNPNGDGWLVTFKVTNQGATTAAGLTITGELKDGGTVVQSSDVTIDYLPAHSQRDGGLFFTEDPARYRLELRAMGYGKP